MRREFISFFLGLLFAGALYAGMPDSFPYNAYDGLNPGVRNEAMGGAGLCSKRDASAIFVNPAALQGVSNKFLVSFKVRQSPEEIASKNDIMGGRSMTFLGFVGSGMGIAWQPMSNFSSLTQGTTAEVKVKRLTMSFSNTVSGPVDFGMNINYYEGYLGIKPSGEIADANGYSIDWGLIYRAHPNITFATSLMNSPAAVKWSSYGTDKPPVVSRSGASCNLAGLLTVSSEVEIRKYQKSRDYDGKKNIKIYHAGIEQSLLNVIFLRGGLFGEALNDNKKTGYSAGMGWRQGSTDVDISWRREYANPKDSEYLQTYYFSISAPF